MNLTDITNSEVVSFENELVSIKLIGNELI